MTGIRTRYEPDLRNTVIYDRFYSEVYAELYERVRDLIGRIAEINRRR
jgi:hypothetical protein